MERDAEEAPLADYNKPIPVADQFVSKPFWDGAKAGKLMLPRCKSCDKVHFYPRTICPFCHSTDIEWFEASGEGSLYTFAVQNRGSGGWGDDGPFVTAYIDLKEGDRIFTVLRGVDPDKPEEITIGAKCQIEWDEASDEVSVPFWRVVE